MRLVKSDIHNHLRTSSHITPEIANASVKKASRQLGPGGILGVINFNPSETETDPRWSLFQRYLRYDTIKTLNGLYLPELDLLAVRGQEFPASEGYHLLMIGTTPDQNISNGTSLEKAFKESDAFGCIVIADHPFGKHGIGAYLQAHPQLYENIHGYETFNPLSISSRYNANQYAQKEFQKARQKHQHLFEVISSDGHSVYEIGKSWTKIEMPESDEYIEFKNSPEKVIKRLREGYLSNTALGLGSKCTLALRGAYDHYFDLVILTAAKKILHWDPNQKTAPLIEKISLGFWRI